MTTQVHTTDSIKALLETSNAAVEKALIVLYARQTADEQSSEETKHQNGVGFNAVDANILSSFAAQVESKQGKYDSYLNRARKLGECLSPKQMTLARKKITRYSRQLAEIANSKVKPVEEATKPTKTQLEGAAPEIAARITELIAQGRDEDAAEMAEAFAIEFEMAGELEAAREELAREEIRTTAYYNGRRTVDIQRERVETLEKAFHQGHSAATIAADPEARAFRAARNSISDWLRK